MALVKIEIAIIASTVTVSTRLVVLEDPDVEGPPEQERLEHRDAGRDDDQHEHGREAEPVGLEQREDPARVSRSRVGSISGGGLREEPRSERIAPEPPAP